MRNSENQSYRRAQRFASNWINDAKEEREHVLTDALNKNVSMSWDNSMRLFRAEAILRNRVVMELAEAEDSETPVSDEIVSRLQERALAAGRSVVSSRSTSDIANLMEDLDLEINCKLLSYITGI